MWGCNIAAGAAHTWVLVSGRRVSLLYSHVCLHKYNAVPRGCY